VFGETDEQTGKKLAAALAADLQPVLCVGETLPQREAGRNHGGRYTPARGGNFAGHAGKGRVTIAYEPVWAIGTDATPRRRTPPKCTAPFVVG